MVTTEIAIKKNLSYVDLSLVIPVYNQQDRIIDTLKEVNQVLEKTVPSYEILVVNDGSIDDTWKIIQKEAEYNQNVKSFSYSENIGKGYAVKTGISHSKGNFVLFLDADREISTTEIKTYIQELENFDLVIGSKTHRLSQVNAPRLRKFLSASFNLLVRILVGIKIKDTQSGLKAGRGPVLRSIFKILTVKRYAFDVELIMLSNLLNLKIKEMPIKITQTNHFKINEIIKMFFDVLSICYRYKIIKSYQNFLKLRTVN